MRARPVVLARALGLALVLALCGCTGAGSPSGTASSSGPAVLGAQVSDEHADADVAFVQQMHPHHEGALAMAELAATRAGDPRITALAARITAGQAPQLARFEALATAWEVELTGDAGGEHDETDDAAVLQGLSGAEFDRQFLTRMVAHHESALPMATAELERGTNPDARALATQVLEAQQAEIAEMQQLLTGL